MILVSVWTNTPYRAGIPVCSIILRRFSRACTLIREQKVPCPSFYTFRFRGQSRAFIFLMEKLIFDLTHKVLLLQRNSSVLNLAISQRAKFEGWLKFELAFELSQKYSDTSVEKYVNRRFIDIYANNSLIELKTPNTNFAIEGVEPTSGRPITKNIQGINDDIKKLIKVRGSFSHGYIVFVMFPIDDIKYHDYVNRVVSKLRGASIVKGAVSINNFDVYVFVAKVF